MTYKYESPSQYRKTQSSIDSLNLEKVQLQEQLEKSQQDQGLLQRGLSLIGRPLSATSSALAASLRGESPLQGFIQGITGQGGIRGGADILEQQGVPELGALETPFGRFTGRGALGFGMDVFLDPLSLATLPIGGVSALGRVARLPTALRAAAPAAARIVPRSPVPELAETTTRMFEPTAARAIGQKLSQIPGIGPIIERIAGPAALAQTPLDKSLMGFERLRSMKQNIVNVGMAPLRAMRMPFKIQDTPQGRLVFIETLNQWVPDNDLPQFIQALNPAQRTWLETASGMRKPLLRQAQEAGVTFEKGLAPEALDDIFVSRRVIGQLEVEPITGKRIIRPIGGQKAVQLSQKYKSQAEGMDAWLIYADLEKSQQMAMGELVEAIATKQLADDLARLGIAALKGKGLEKLPTEALAGIPGSPAFKGFRFSVEDRDQIMRHFVARQPAGLGKVRTATDIVRTLGTTYDFSGQFIQNLIMMVTHPIEWGKIWGQSFKAVLNPASHQAFIAQNADLLREVPDLVISGSEYMAGAERLGRLPGMARFQSAFDVAGDAARIYWVKALRPLYLADPSLKEAIVSYANKATGTLSTQALGITPTQQMIEGTFLLFAPRYVRANLALASQVLSGGLRGDLARDALSNMLVAGLAFYNRVGILAGLDDEEIARRLDPTNPSFLTMDAGPMKISVGGIWIAMAKMLGRISEDPTLAIQYDPDNPIYRFLAGRLAPGTSMARDLLVNKETYVGQPLETPIDIGLYVGSRLLPFAISNMAMSGLLGVPPTPAEAGAELATGFMGMQARPATRQDMLEQVSRDMFGKSYQSLNPIQQGQVQGSPKVQQVPLPQGKRFEETRTEAEIWKQYREPLEQEAQRVLAKQSTPNAFRQLEAQLSDERNARLSMQAPKEFERIPMEEKRQKYFEFFRTRPPDYEGAETYLSSLTPTERDYINAKQQGAYARLGGEAAGLMTELFNARQKLQPYWNTQEKALRAVGLWKRWVEANPVQKDKIAQSDAYKKAQRVWGKARENMRKSNPALDKLLVKWYGYQPSK